MSNEYPPYAGREDAVEEYRSLRSEIIESQKQRITLLEYSIAFIAGVFGYSFKAGGFDPVVALFPWGSLYTSCWLIATSITLLNCGMLYKTANLPNYISHFKNKKKELMHLEQPIAQQTLAEEIPNK